MLAFPRQTLRDQNERSCQLQSFANCEGFAKPIENMHQQKRNHPPTSCTVLNAKRRVASMIITASHQATPYNEHNHTDTLLSKTKINFNQPLFISAPQKPTLLNSNSIWTSNRFKT